ncbi:MAG TPA: ABC transporter substrate-binding protein [Candidatus Paceibacterota bacterium]
MNKRIFGVVIVIVLIALAVALYTNTRNVERDPITVGFVGPLTGGPALWGEGARNMVALAVEDINAEGGVDGRQLVVDYQDGKCNPKDGALALNTLKAKGVKLVIGGHCSPETGAMVPLTKDGSAFMIAGITTSDEAVSGSDYAYRTSPPNLAFTRELVKIGYPKFQKIASITEEAAFSRSYTDDFTKLFTEAGGTVVHSEAYAPDTTDFRSMLLKIKESSPEAVFISPQSPTTGALIAKQMTELGMKLPLFGNSVFVTPGTYASSENSPLVIGSFSVVPYADSKGGDALTLANRYEEKYGHPVPYNFFFVSASYDATMMLAQAIDKCDEDTACVADFFSKINYKGVSADYTFKENGDSSFANFASITIGEDGKTIIKPL